MKIILILFFAVSNFLTIIPETKSVPYNYPVMPGSDLWKRTESYVDRVKLCNIPDSILNDMSTGDLVLSVFDFPYSQNLILYDNFLWGFENLKSIFNGLAELEKRNEAGQVLFKRYINPDENNNLAQNILLENLMALSFVQNNIDSTQKSLLLDSCLNKLSERLDSKHFLTEKSIVSSCFLMLRTLSYLNENAFNTVITENEDIKKFAETSEPPEKETLEKIIAAIIQFKN